MLALPEPSTGQGPSPDGNAATDADKRKAPVRSPYLFPAYSLGNALQIAGRVEADGGGSLTEETLAIGLQLSAKSSGFRLKTLTTRQFGLLTKQGERVATTPLAKAILKPLSETERAGALRQAFMTIPLFRAVAERFKGQPLPPESSFRNVLEREFGIEAARVATALRMLLDSAREAGVLRQAGSNTYLTVEGAFMPAPTMTPAPSFSGPTASATPPAPVYAPAEAARSPEATVPDQPSSAGMLVISERDLAEFGDQDFEQVWKALGKVFRARGRRQMREAGNNPTDAEDEPQSDTEPQQ